MPFPTSFIRRWHRGFIFLQPISRQPSGQYLVTTIMPASPNEQIPSPTTIIQLSSPILDTPQALRANPAKIS